MNKFWIVYRIDCVCGFDNTPTKKHLSLEDATKEAERLCRETKGTFVILEAIKKCKMRDVKWEDINEIQIDEDNYDKIYDEAMECIERKI